MEDISLEFNELILREVGLDINKKNLIVDQETGNELSFKDRPIVAPGVDPKTISKNAIEFDPYNNSRLMDRIYGLFATQYEEEYDTHIYGVYSVPPDKKDEFKIACRTSDENQEVITSGSYKRDSLCYADLILKMNGEDRVDLKKFNQPKPDKKKVGK